MTLNTQHPIVQEAVLGFEKAMIDKGILPDPWDILNKPEDQRLNTLTSLVCTGISKHGYAAQRFSCETEGLRCHRAEQMGLEPIEASSEDMGSFAEVLATHPALPDVLVKVVPETDAFVRWARYLLSQESPQPCFPKIYNVATVDGHAVILCELIPGYVLEEGEWEDASSQWYASKGAEEVYQFIADTGTMSDFHNENFMRREDGTLVCIDPVYWL